MHPAHSKEMEVTVGFLLLLLSCIWIQYTKPEFRHYKNAPTFSGLSSSWSDVSVSIVLNFSALQEPLQ